MADENLIGLGRCPVCEQPEARFTLTKSNLVCVTCRQRRCGFQGFSRTGDADEKLRDRIGTTSPEPAMPPAPAPAPAPTPTPTPEPAAQKTKPSKPSWGISFGA